LTQIIAYTRKSKTRIYNVNYNILFIQLKGYFRHYYNNNYSTCNLVCSFRFPKAIIIDGQLPDHGSHAVISHVHIDAREIANIKSVAKRIQFIFK